MQELIGKTIQIDNGMWDVCGKDFKVLSEDRIPFSTGIRLELRDNTGGTQRRTVPSHQIIIKE